MENSAENKTQSSGSFDVLKSKPFLVLWSNQILLQLSYNMLSFTLLVLLFKLTHSNTVSALFLLTNLVPATLFAMFAGVVSDKFDRRKILLITDFGAGLCIFLYLFIPEVPIFILGLTLILNSILQFFGPAESASIPTLVPKKDLLAANSLFQTTFFASTIVGYSIAGPLIEQFGHNIIFIFGAISLAVTFVLRRFLPSMPTLSESSGTKHTDLRAVIKITKSHIAEGLNFITKNRNVWVVILVLGVVNALANLIVTVGPGLMEEVLKIRAEGASIVILLPLGIGLVIGALSIGRFGSIFPKRHIISTGFFLSGIAILLIVISPVIASFIIGREINFSRPVHFLSALKLSYVISFASIILGAGAAFIIVPSQTLLQEFTPDHLRGRVFSTQIMVLGIFAAIPVFTVGALSDIFGVQIILGIISLFILTLGFLGLKAEHTLIKIDEFLLKITRREIKTVSEDS